MTQKHARIPCPFEPCKARPEVLAMRGVSLEVPGRDMVREHELEPDSWFGTCPASNTYYPPDAATAAMLTEQLGTFERMRPDHAPAAAPSGPVQGPARPPRPVPSWFRSNPGGGDPRQTGPTALPKLTQTTTTPKGGSVPSVAETRAAIDAANQAIAEAQAAARVAAQRIADAQAAVTAAKVQFEQAQRQLAFVQGQTTDALGTAYVNAALGEVGTAELTLTAALEAVELAAQHATPAIEKNAAYGSML